MRNSAWAALVMVLQCSFVVPRASGFPVAAVSDAGRASINVTVTDTNGHPVKSATVVVEEYGKPGTSLKKLTSSEAGVATGIAEVGDDRLAVSVTAPGYAPVKGLVVPRHDDEVSGASSFTTAVLLEAVIQPTQPGTCSAPTSDQVRCTFYVKNASPEARAATQLRFVIQRVQETCSNPGMFVRLRGDASGATFFASDAAAFGPDVEAVIAGAAEIDCGSGTLTLTMSHGFPQIAPQSAVRIGISLPNMLRVTDGAGVGRTLRLVTKQRTATASVVVDGGVLFAGEAALAFEVR